MLCDRYLSKFRTVISSYKIIYLFQLQTDTEGDIPQANQVHSDKAADSTEFRQRRHNYLEYESRAVGHLKIWA